MDAGSFGMMTLRKSRENCFCGEALVSPMTTVKGYGDAADSYVFCIADRVKFTPCSNGICQGVILPFLHDGRDLLSDFSPFMLQNGVGSENGVEKSNRHRRGVLTVDNEVRLREFAM